MIEVVNQLPRELDRVQWWSIVVGAIAWVICILGWIFSPANFFTAYLYSFLFFFGITAGSMSLVMLHHLTGGNWGRPIRGILEAAMSLMPLMAVLFVPMLFGLRHMYEWAVPDIVAGDKTLQHQQPYLNQGFFVLRVVIYFAIWSGLSIFMSFSALRYQQTRSQSLALWMRRVSAAGILLYGITMSFASVDWVMSRQSHWHSTILGFIFLAGQALAAMAFAIIILRTIVDVEPLPEYVSSRVLVDLGNLLMTLVILWSYLSFAQFLIIWMGNSRHEVTWYVQRGVGPADNSWSFIAALLIVFHFFIPFVLLLFRYNKRHFNILTAIAAMVLVMRVIDLYWWTAPSSLHRAYSGFFISWITPFPLLAIGGVWVFCFIWLLRRRPLISRLEIEPSPIVPHGHATAPRAI